MARFFGISEYRVVKGEFWVNLLIRRTSNFFLFWIVKYKLNLVVVSKIPLLTINKF